MNVQEAMELLKDLPPGLPLMYPVKHAPLQNLAPGDYDSYEGMPTGDHAECHLYYQPGDSMVTVEHW